MISEARIVALDRVRPGEMADRSGELLDIVYGWADFAKLRKLVSRQCDAAGLAGSRLDDFVLAVHEISANAIVHAGAGGRLVLRRVASGLRCLITDTPAPGTACPAPRPADLHDVTGDGDPDAPAEPIGADSGRGLWLAATLADELRITSGPDGIVVSLYMRLE
ncbi:MAG: ATP-binding protein [Streptosporangiaceae bacterium]